METLLDRGAESDLVEAGVALRNAPMNQGETSDGSSYVEREIVTGLLRDCQGVGGVAQGDRIGQQ